MSHPAIARIAHFTLNVEKLDRTADFYVKALGFTQVAATAETRMLRLGTGVLELVERPGAAPYPRPRAANDPWFQHFAIVVADMAAAYAHLSSFDPEPITRGGPQLLPPSTGSVTAYKFRDPDGHPLELFYAAGASPAVAAPDRVAGVFLSIDHTALAVSDLDVSVSFYTDLGFRVGERLLNRRAEQARLDGLEGACLDIVTLFTPLAGPHLELLHYRQPTPAPARTIDGIAATETTLASALDAGQRRCSLQDPDGHRLRFVA